mmetsp:Transcript_36980/g.73579  ORF Transcript_36980/g.73579 Transcript_36980/m.73579 type:complete len:239 (-) Transcript_36980:80-796(-)
MVPPVEEDQRRVCDFEREEQAQYFDLVPASIDEVPIEDRAGAFKAPRDPEGAEQQQQVPQLSVQITEDLAWSANVLQGLGPGKNAARCRNKDGDHLTSLRLVAGAQEPAQRVLHAPILVKLVGLLGDDFAHQGPAVRQHLQGQLVRLAIFHLVGGHGKPPAPEFAPLCQHLLPNVQNATGNLLDLELSRGGVEEVECVLDVNARPTRPAHRGIFALLANEMQLARQDLFVAADAVQRC